MSLASYKARVRNDGGSIQGASNNITRKAQFELIRNSPSRSTVGLHSKDNLEFALVSDIDTYEKRRFLFNPDVKTYKGDYIYHDDFIYLVTNHTIDNNFPQSIALLCNYDFPVRVEEITTHEIIGRRPSGQPIYKIEPITHTIPSAVTSKFYSAVENAVFSLPEGVMYAYLPYRPDEPSPQLDQEVLIYDQQYFVADIIKTNILNFGGIDKGYIELRMQRVQKNGNLE